MSDQKLDLILAKLDDLLLQLSADAKSTSEPSICTDNPLTDINAKLDELRNDVKQIKAQQYDHNKILELLSIRSIAQEADIADLQKKVV